MTYWTEARLRSADEQIPVMDVRELFSLARLLVCELVFRETGDRRISDREMAVEATALGIGTPIEEESCPLR